MGYTDGGYYGLIAEQLNDPRGNADCFHRVGWAPNRASASAFKDSPAEDRRQIFLCPSSANELVNKTGSGCYTNYGYNRCVIAVSPGDYPTNVAQLSDTSRTIFMYDGYAFGMDTNVYLLTGDPYVVTSCRVAWLAHNKGSNFTFMDGHVERVGINMAKDTSWYAKRKYNSTASYLW